MRKSTAGLAILGASALAVAALSVADDTSSERGDTELRSAERRATTLRASTGGAAPLDDGLYRLDEVMIRLDSAADLDSLVADLGVHVRDRAGGAALLEVPAGMERAELLLELSADPRVRSASPNAVMRGAAGQARKSGRAANGSDQDDGEAAGGASNYVDMQWHLNDISMPDSPRDLASVVVAVVDSGVAYEAATIDGTAYVVPSSLQGTTFVHPRDLVDDDMQPLDEHQHGTHITSLIASDGVVKGVAPGVQIMPIRVLDEHNSGTEWDLIEGLRWAIVHDADVINMSLAFPPGYVPSSFLQEALQTAADSGIVMIGAAGNDARDDVPSWPAASPVVIGVGAYVAPSGTDDEAAWYSNLGTSLDVMAPGGDLSYDHDKDGMVDGMVAETINLNDPGTAGAWMFAGTSQAAAVVSGAAAWLVAGGADAEMVRASMLHGSDFWGDSSFAQGLGAGGLNVDLAVDSVTSRHLESLDRFGAAVLAWPAPVFDAQGVETGVVAKARITIVDSDGEDPREPLDVFGTVWGPDGASPWSCKLTATTNRCTITGDAALGGRSGGPAAAWAFSVDAVVEPQVEVPHRPSTVLYASDALELILAAQAADPALAEMPLAVEWAQGSDPTLGPVAAGYTVMNAGSGLATSPFGLVFTPRAMDISALDVQLDLDGTGLATSPVGLFQMRALTIDGSGLATSPVGFQQMRLLSFSGTGLATSPVGFSAHDLFSPDGTAPSLGMGLNGGVMFLDESVVLGTTGAGAATDALLTTGGFRTLDGYEVASVLAGSGAAAVGLDAGGSAVAMSESGIALP